MRIEKKFFISNRFSAKTVLKLLRSVIKDYTSHCEMGFVAHAILKDMDDVLTCGVKAKTCPFIVLGELARLVDLQSMINLYKDSEISKFEFSILYQVRDLFRKYQDSSGAERRKAVALEKYLQCESDLARFDIRTINWSDDERVVDCFTYARSIIQRVLGEEPCIDNRFYMDCRHGPGANLGHRGKNSAKFDKFAKFPYHVSTRALGHARRLVFGDERWMDAIVERIARDNDILISDVTEDMVEKNIFHITDANSVVFVPKDGTTDRPIAIEPDLNLMLQLGVDGVIRRGLNQHMGIDLNDQSRNQYLAKLGSINGTLATLDLSSASDTISLDLCEFLLPSKWFTFLCDLRSPYGSVDGLEEALTYEKISSMGNGYTFALESLIFAAIAYGVARVNKVGLNSKNFHVYGDDIIVPTTICVDVMSMLELSGFTINREKSFVEGPFRESCGADFLDGYNVRPVSQKWEMTTIWDLMQFSNKILARLEEDLYVNRFETHTWHILNVINSEMVNYRGPISEDSYTYLHDPSYRSRKGIYKWKTLVLKPKKKKLVSGDFNFVKLLAALKPELIGGVIATLEDQRIAVRRRRWLEIHKLPLTSPLMLQSVLEKVKEPIGVFDVVGRKSYDSAITFRRCPQWTLDSTGR